MEASTFSLAGFKGMRNDLLVALRKEQPLTAKELGQRFGVTANALRRILKEMEDTGLVRYRREVRGVGGPVYAYSLTAKAEELFPRSYANPLADALTVVRAEQGAEGVVRIFRKRWETIAAEAMPALASLPLPARARALAALLSQQGYMAESDEAAGNVRIREHNCVVKEIATQFPEVCSAEAAFISDVLGVTIERHQHIATGCSSCEYTARSLPALQEPL